MGRGRGMRPLDGRRWAAAGAVVIAAAAALVPAESPRAQAACANADTIAAPPEDLAAAALCLVDEARARVGVPPLRRNATLDGVARADADRLVATDTFSITGPGGSTPLGRARAAGYDATRVHEGIAYGDAATGTPRAVVRGWLAKPELGPFLLAADTADGGGAVTVAHGGRFGDGTPVYAVLAGRPEAPVPVPGRTVVARVVSGTVTVTRPGGTPVALTDVNTIPLGATIDATRGRLDLTAARTRSGRTQHALFYSGAFVPRQTPSGSTLLTTLTLTGGAATPRSVVATAARRRKPGGKPKRLLWGDGKGRYRTDGTYASATVRGTKWLTEDYSNGTLVRVARGVVEVRERRTGRIHRVRAGHSVFVGG